MRVPRNVPTLQKIFKEILEAFPQIRAFEPTLQSGIEQIGGGEKFFEIFRPVDSKERYVHWEKLRFLTPPAPVSHKTWWLLMKITRQNFMQRLPFFDKHGLFFSFAAPPMINERLHRIDQKAGGILVGEASLNPQTRAQYIMRSLLEESIHSSLLEGAATTLQEAKSLLLRQSPPRNKHERMVTNNYRAMKRIQEWKQEALTPEMVFELQRLLTEGTLDNPDQAGRFRRADEPIQVFDQSNQEVLHTPPPAEELPERLQLLCDFANQKTHQPFIHPVIKAILLHFILAYDHPFVDGNGRTARALFYWYMLQQNYWLMSYISISGILAKAPAQYGNSFLYSETDDNDATYFIDHQLNVILRALDEFYQKLERQTAEIQSAERLMSPRLRERLNFRQLHLIRHALRHPGQSYEIKSHQTYHNLAYQTARQDLLDLAKLELLLKVKHRQSFLFIAPADLAERLRSAGKA